VTSPRPHPVRSILAALVVLALDAALLALGFGDASMLVRDPRAIALLAVWGVAGIVLALLRPARGQDLASVRPDPFVMLALFVLPLAAAPLAAFGARRAIDVLPYANTLSWCGVALVAAGLALRIAAMARLGRRFAPVVALQKEHALETGGPYAFVRHPGYLGALLACLGASVVFGSALALPVPALMLVAQLARVHREEALLAAGFGEEWARYSARTGALLPRLFGRGRNAA
jgi:protein-S-isoprenylcysteine O-methyltransferase Ste14